MRVIVPVSFWCVVIVAIAGVASGTHRCRSAASKGKSPHLSSVFNVKNALRHVVRLAVAKVKPDGDADLHSVTKTK